MFVVSLVHSGLLGRQLYEMKVSGSLVYSLRVTHRSVWSHMWFCCLSCTSAFMTSGVYLKAVLLRGEEKVEATWLWQRDEGTSLASRKPNANIQQLYEATFGNRECSRMMPTVPRVDATGGEKGQLSGLEANVWWPARVKMRSQKEKLRAIS